MELLENWEVILAFLGFVLWFSRVIAGTKTRQEEILEAIKASRRELSAEHAVHDKALTQAVSRLEQKLDEHVRAHEIETVLSERTREEISFIRDKHLKD